MTRRGFQTPAGVSWLLLSMAAGPLLGLFTPTGLLGHGDEPDARLQQIAYLSGLLGTLFSMVALEDARWMLDRCGPMRRVLLRWVAMLTPGLIGPAAVLAVAAIQGVHPHWLNLLPPLAISLLHLTLLAGWILETPGTSRNRLLLLPFLSWLLPAVMQSATVPVSWALDLVRSHPRAFGHEDPSQIELLVGIGPIVVLAASHVLLVRWLQTYEVRHSR